MADVKKAVESEILNAVERTEQLRELETKRQYLKQLAELVTSGALPLTGAKKLFLNYR